MTVAKPSGRQAPPRTWRDLRARLETWGWTMEISGGGHWKVRDGDVTVMTLPVTSSDRKAVLNAWSEAKKRRRSIDKEARK